MAGGLTVEVYRPKAGTMLIWHDDLMHGGARHIDRASRRFIVGHDVARGAMTAAMSRCGRRLLRGGGLPCETPRDDSI